MPSIAIFVALVVVAAVIIYVVQRQLRTFQERVQKDVRGDLENVRAAVTSELGGVRKEVNDQLTGVTQSIVQMQGQVAKQMQDGAAALTDTLGGIKRDMGELAQATERIREVGRNIASLQDILRAPKIRGGLGESTLENLLGQVFPSGSYYALQHSFQDGMKVDAVVRLGQSLVPIDAKFPLENFQKMLAADDDKTRASLRRDFIKDVAKHINDIADKYIRPAEGTYDFALMYIPAESVYYEVITKGDGGKDIYALALERRVLPVSPNTFYAYLQVVVFGLRGLHIEQRAQEIVAGLASLSNDFRKFTEDFEILGRHLRNAQTKYDDADKRRERFDAKLTAAAEASGASAEAAPEPLGAPALESGVDDNGE